MSDYSTKKMPSIRLSHFINLSDSFYSDNVSKSQNSTKFSRNFEGGVVGLGIVAAMNEINDSHEAFISANTSKAVEIAVSARSEPIPIVSAKSVTRFKEPILEKDEMEMSESYTCVISHFGKREYVDETDGINGNYLADSEMFFASPQAPTLFQAADFLSSCYLCRKKLHGLDIFMYRGDKAFCSVECRCKQILSDEHKEKCGSGALKSFDYSVSPCSGPRLFSTGVKAA